MAARRIATPLAVVTLLLSVWCSAAQAVPPPPPLIGNGDFESSTLDPWVEPIGGVRLAGQSDWVAASGKQSVELPGESTLYQNVSTTAGQRYDLSFAYAGNPNVDPWVIGCEQQGVKAFDVSWPGTLPGYGAGGAALQFDTTGHATSSMGWQTAHLLVDSASASTQLMFRADDAFGCGVALDNVAMQPASVGQTGIQLSSERPFAVTGEPLTVVATVLGASADVTPTGSVQFSVDGTPRGGPVALSGGQAQIVLTGLARDRHWVAATYAPDSAGFSASSVTQHFSVLQAETATGVSVDSSPVPVGQEVTVTANVGVFAPGSGTPTGSVQFSDESEYLGDPVPLDADGTAQLRLLEDEGDHVIYASYTGDDGFMGSSGETGLRVFDPNQPPPVVPPTHTRISTTTSLVSSKNPVAHGESYTVTATVAPATTSDARLDGTIKFTSGTVALSDPVPLDGSHSATITVTAPATGTSQGVRAAYSGNGSFLGSTRILAERLLQPPPAPAVRDLQAPIFTVALTPARLRNALRSGIRAHVGCNENCSASLRLSLSARRAKALGIKVHGKSVVVARGGYDFADRTASDIVVRFLGRYRKALSKARRLPLRLSAEASDVGGNDSVHVKAITLKR